MDLAASKTHIIQCLNWPEFHWASVGIRPVQSLRAVDVERVARWRCGRIVTEHSRLSKVVGRWWPYEGSLLQAAVDKRLRPVLNDRCELYYHQPLGMSSFLTLSYIRSGPRTTLSTFFLATLALDFIASQKHANAIVCNVTNDRISDRLLQRWGWESHCPDWRGRHFIKRFYGEYPEISPHWRSRLSIDND